MKMIRVILQKWNRNCLIGRDFEAQDFSDMRPRFCPVVDPLTAFPHFSQCRDCSIRVVQFDVYVQSIFCLVKTLSGRISSTTVPINSTLGPSATRFKIFWLKKIIMPPSLETTCLQVLWNHSYMCIHLLLLLSLVFYSDQHWRSDNTLNFIPKVVTMVCTY